MTEPLRPAIPGVTFGYTSAFDFMVEKARVRENALARLYSDNDLKVELKSDEAWGSTGNIAIEYSSKGKPSGIAVTEADVWVQELYDAHSMLVARMQFHMPTLKAICRVAKAEGKVRLGGKEHDCMNVILSPFDLRRGLTMLPRH